MTFLRAAVSWFALMIAAIVNGVFRESVLLEPLGSAWAHVVSTVMLCVLVLVLAWLLTPWVRPVTPRRALAVGGLWLAMTVAFEFGFGRLVAGRSWAELMADYDVTAGRIWVLVLLTVLAAPYAVARLRRLV